MSGTSSARAQLAFDSVLDLADRFVAIFPQRSRPPARTALRLRDGRYVVVRPARPVDASGLLHLYNALSPESRYSRYFTAGGIKSRADARRLAAGAQAHDAVLVAVAGSPYSIVAVGQLCESELALTVRDDYQGVGLGSLLLSLLMSTAQSRGLPRVQATVLTTNARVLRLLLSHGAQLRGLGDGLVHAQLDTRAGSAPPSASIAPSTTWFHGETGRLERSGTGLTRAERLERTWHPAAELP